MIKHILDKYFADKLQSELVDMVKCTYCLDVKSSIEDGTYCIWVKRREYKDTEYQLVSAFDREQGLIILFNLDKYKKGVHEVIKNAIKAKNWY